MGYRFWKSVKVAPGVRLNLGRSGPSLSVGPRGAKFTIGMNGTRTTVGIPGTGLYYTQRQSYGSGGSHPQPIQATQPASAVTSNLTLGFFQKLVTPPEEQEFVSGCRETALGNKDAALVHLRNAIHIPDAAYLAGVLAGDKNLLDEAEKHFNFAAQHGNELGVMLRKYGLSSTMTLNITDEFTAYLPINEQGMLLALVEIYQIRKRYEEAAKTLQRLYDLNPSDLVVRLSIAELFMESRPQDEAACKKVLQLVDGVENDSPIHAALLLYKAKAFLGLSMPTSATEVLSKIIRKTKDRSEELLHAIRYERALAYQAAGQNRRYSADLEKLYAEVPDYEDVAKRLGMG